MFSLGYSSIQVFSSGWILDSNMQLCCGRKCLRGIAYYEWLKRSSGSTISAHLGRITEKQLAPAVNWFDFPQANALDNL